jgi:hypothetical protein
VPDYCNTCGGSAAKYTCTTYYCGTAPCNPSGTQCCACGWVSQSTSQSNTDVSTIGACSGYAGSGGPCTGGACPNATEVTCSPNGCPCSGTIGCDGVCNSGKTKDACGYCGGSVGSCATGCCSGDACVACPSCVNGPSTNVGPNTTCCSGTGLALCGGTYYCAGTGPSPLHCCCASCSSLSPPPWVTEQPCSDSLCGYAC